MVSDESEGSISFDKIYMTNGIICRADTLQSCSSCLKPFNAEDVSDRLAAASDRMRIGGRKYWRPPGRISGIIHLFGVAGFR